MPTPTYIPLATKTLTASASSVTFSSIVGTYRDLVLVCANLRTNTSTGSLRVRINADTTSVYQTVHAAGSSTTPGSFANGNTGFAQLMGNASITTTANNTTLVNFFDYAATDKHKSFLVRANQATNTEMVAGRYPSTSAITQIEVLLSTNSFATNTVFTLYGIAG